jgi:nucleoside-diphosphate-sugar epimerase
MAKPFATPHHYPMRLLIIGGSGFIGRELVPRLVAAGHTVGIVQRPSGDGHVAEGAESVRVDRRDLPGHAGTLRRFAPDVVVDLVLSSGRQAEELIDVFVGHTKRIVAVTSADVYRAAAVLHGFDNGPLEPVPLTEESAFRVTTQTYPPVQIEALKKIFGWLDDEYDKVAVERALRARADLAITILRLPMIYGPGDQLHRLYPVVKRIDDKRPALLLAESVAQWRAPRGYVGNVAAAIALAATTERAAGRTFNVAEQPSFTELEWTRLVADAMNWAGDILVMPDELVPSGLRIPGRLEQHWAVDSTRIRSELGYTEPVALMDGLRRTIAWERANPPSSNSVLFDYAAEDAALAQEKSGGTHVQSS